MKGHALTTASASALLLATSLLPACALAAAAPGFDGDVDGVEDTADACPLSPAGAVVDRQGCALDEDVDGTADGVDRCPNTPLGAAVDARGCAPAQRPLGAQTSRAATASTSVSSVVAIKPAPSSLPPAPLPRIVVPTSKQRPAMPPAGGDTAMRAARASSSGRSLPELTLYFDGGDSRLSAESRRALEDTRDLLREDLERNAQATLVLSGHADTKIDGHAAAPRLAAQRVSAVRQALIEAGLPPQRLSVRAAGVGEPRYAGSELARNCRVEIRLQGRHSPPPEGLAGKLGPPPTPVESRPPPPRLRTVVVAKYRPPTASAVAVAASVNFADYSARLDDRATITLTTFAANLGDRLRKHPQTQVVISGSIDGSETGEPAQRLSQSRALSVQTYLKNLGLPPDQLAIVSDTVSTRADGSGRRVDLRVIAPAF